MINYDSISEAFQELQRLYLKEDSEDYSQLANYGSYEYFLDMLGDNPTQQMRILANYRDTSADFDPNGTHVCFSSDVFGEPKVMPDLKFGFIFNKDKVQALAAQQGWTQPMPYNDFDTRLLKRTEYSYLPNTPRKSKVIDYKGNPQKRKNLETNKIKLVGLLKIINNDGSEKFYICFAKYTWREIDEEIFEFFKSKILDIIDHGTPAQIQSFKTNRLSIFGSDIEGKLKYFSNSQDDKSIYTQIAYDENLCTKKIKEAYIFGHDTHLDIYGTQEAEPGIKSFMKDNKISKMSFQNGLNIYKTPAKKSEMVVTIGNTSVYTKLNDIFFENEFRIYRQKESERVNMRKLYFTFSINDVENIAIPKQWRFGNKTYPCELLYEYWKSDRLFESYKIDESGYKSYPQISTSEIKWWKNPKPAYDADAWNAITMIDGKWARVRSCVLIFRRNPETGEQEACVVFPNESVNTYELPGGGLDNLDDAMDGRSEDPKDTAIRESAEEVNAKIGNLKYVDSYIRSFDSSWVKKNVSKEYQWNLYYTYLFTADYEGPISGIADEDYAWVPIRELVLDSKFNCNASWMKAIYSKLSPQEISELKDLQQSDKSLNYRDVQENTFFADFKQKTGVDISKLDKNVLRFLQKVFLLINNRYHAGNKIVFYNY